MTEIAAAEATAQERYRSRPATYEPPYDAHTSIFPAGWTDYVMGMFAVQTGSGVDGAMLASGLDDVLGHAPMPLHVERVRETDADGAVNDIRIAYWQTGDEYRAWIAAPAVAAFFAQPLAGGAGLWREALVAPADNVDPSGFAQRHVWGVGRHIKQVWEKYHAYYGSMRDRIPNGHSAAIEGDDSPLVERTGVESRGRRLRVDAPHNICLIRGVFGWRNADPAQRGIFIDEMLPVYERGAYHLRDYPQETLCISARVSREIDTDPPTGIDAETIAWFTSLKSLEEWTHHHETHAAIFRKSHEIGMRFDFKLTLDFGHEVVVVPAGGLDAEYNNCHPRTGLLRWFDAYPPD